MTDRQVKIVLDGEVGDAAPVDTGTPQGSPAAPILFTTYLSGNFDEVENVCLGIKALSFVDDVAWWAQGKNDQEVAKKLEVAAGASLAWAARNGIVFDHGKTEATLFHRKRTAPTATIKAGDLDVGFNNEATQWIGVWLDLQLTLKCQMLDVRR